MILYIQLIAHLLAEFTFQSGAFAISKRRQVSYLITHSLIYSSIMAISLLSSINVYFAWLPLAIISGIHLAAELARSLILRQSSSPAVHFLSFLAEEALDALVICGVVHYFRLEAHAHAWLTTAMPSDKLMEILRYILLFVVLLDPASAFVKKLTLYVSGKTDEIGVSNDPPIGSIIGKLERILISVLVINNSLEAIGFVLTAKSIARFKQFDNKDFAEKYLVGTLASSAIAVLAALLLK